MIPVLGFPKGFKFLSCFHLRFQCCNFPFMRQDGVIGKLQKTIRKACPILHLHQDLPFSAILSKVEIRRNNAVKFCNMCFVEVILSYRCIAFYTLPSGAFFQVVSPICNLSASAAS